MANEDGARAFSEADTLCPYCMSRVVPGESCPVCGLTRGAYTPSPHHLPPGTVLGERYLIGRRLGEGGFGITYIGFDLRLEMKVAIKEYFPSDQVTRYAPTSLGVVSHVGAAGESYEKGLRRFLQEARTMARMEKQPEIVMVRDFFEANNTAYIVMEYVEGTNFKELTEQRGGRIPPEELFRLISPLFGALSAMHAAGLIHRDISPDNLMLERGSVRLLDFGCARESAAGGTETMTVALKKGYAPIEQYYGKGQGPWTDVYALSATIYYCLTGVIPPQSLGRTLEDELVPPRELGVDISPGVQNALLRGMAINPGRRWRSIDELRRGLYSPTEPEVGPDRLPELVARRGGRVQFEELMELMRPAFSQLKRLHATGRLHLGVRPDSLQLRSDGLRLDAPPKDIPAPSGGYAAPELYDSGKEPDARADIYALAGCLYYGLTGVTPPELRARLGRELPEPASFGADIPAKSRAALLRALSLDISERPESVEAFVSALEPDAAEPEPISDERVIPEPVPPEPVSDESAPSKPGPHPDRGGRKLVIALAAVLAAMALILAIALIPRDEGGPESPAIVTGRPESLPDFDELFADAVTVTDAAELAAALEDEAIPAIICSGEVTNEPGAAQLRLTKPVYVPEDGVLDAAHGALVAAEGCTLWVDGYVSCGRSSSFASLVTDGGDIICGENGRIDATLWYTPGHFTLLGESGNIRDVHTLPSEAVFEFAAVVTDFEGFLAAANDPTVTAITVDGPIAVSGQLSVSKPVLVTENGSLGLPEGYSAEGEDVCELQFTAGLINNGSVTCSLWSDDCVLNRGVIEPARGVWAGEQGGSDARVLNLGSMRLSYYSVLWCDTLNLGEISVSGGSDSPGLHNDEGTLFNCGSVTVGRDAELRIGGTLFNAGSLVADGRFLNLGLVVSCGADYMEVNGELENLGLIDMYDGSGVIAGSGIDSSGGAIISRNTDFSSGTEGVWLTDFAAIDQGTEGHRTVASEAELRAALEDPAVGCIDVDRRVEISAPLTLTKPLYVYGEGRLVLAEGAALTVDGVPAAINGLGLEADGVAVVNGGMLEIIAPWTCSGEGAGLSVSGGGWFYSREYALELESCEVESGSLAVLAAYGGSLSLKDASAEGTLCLGADIAGGFSLAAEGGTIIQLGDAESDSGAISVNGGRYNQLGALTLTGGGVTNGGSFLTTSSPLVIAEGAYFRNNGEFRQETFTDGTVTLEGEFVNNGRVYI